MKIIKNLYKYFVQKIFIFIYGKIKIAPNKLIEEHLRIQKITIDKIVYKIFNIKNCRIFTTSVHDQAVILKNNLIPGPSFQLRVKKDDKLFARNDDHISENIVLKIGTPRILKKKRGKVFSLLSGGAAKKNYFHWLFEILPKLKIIEEVERVDKIDFFLLPSTKMDHQIKTLELLNVPKKKMLDSKTFKHINCDELYVVDHPFRLNNDTVIDTQNIPVWIFKYLRENFLKHKSSNLFPKKIFIDRSKLLSTHRDIKNKEEVYKILKEKDYQFIRPEKFEFKDQIQMFFSAEKIVGLHGAAFANICFCNPRTKIIEFKTITTGMNSGNIAIKNHLDYNGIICEAIDKFGGQQGKLIVPLEELVEKI